MVQKKVEKQRLAEEEDKQKLFEYLKQLQDTDLLECTETSHVMESKCKEVTNISSEDKAGLWPSKKLEEKQSKRYCKNTVVKMGVVTPVRGMCMLNKIA